MTPLHIVVVVAGLGAGGAERVIALLTAAWVAKGCQVTVIAFDAPGDPVYHDFHQMVRLVRLGPVQARGVFATIAKIRRLRAAVRALRPGVVISFLTKINVMALLATMGLGVRIIVSERNNPRRQQAHPGWRQLLSRLYARADAIVLQTEASRECLPTTVAAAAVVIPNPITPPAALPATRPRVVAAVGRLEHQKGFDLLITAFAAASRAHPEWRLVIWGEGPRRADLAGQIDAAGMTGRITLPGLSASPGSWLTGAAAFALSSRYEGFPNALAEAMAAGLPVIAFDCPYGPGDLISPGIDGLLIAENDTSGYAAGLDRLMSDSVYRNEIGQAAQRKTTSFDSSNISAAWLQIISSVTVS